MPAQTPALVRNTAASFSGTGPCRAWGCTRLCGTNAPDPGITGHRWWPLPELRTTAEAVYPLELADLLDRLVA